MNKIEEIVDNLNERLYGKDATENLDHVFSYIKSGFVEQIILDLNFDNSHVEIHLWDDQNDSRKWNEKTQEYEDLEKHIIQKYKNVLKDMSKLTKYLCK